MGIIAQRIAQYDEVRNDSGWLTRGDTDDPASTPAGIRVTKQAALGLTTVWRCVDILASAVSQAPRDIYLKIGGRSFPEHNLPSWLIAPNPANPTFTPNDYFNQLAVSMLMDGNYFVYVLPDIHAPRVLTVMDPARVDVKSGPTYDLKNASGQVVETVGPNQMLHGIWFPMPGQLRGLSPLETLRRGISAAIAAEDFGARFFGSGAALSFGVEVPGKMDPTRLDDLRASMRRKYQGLGNSHAIGVLTDGAKFITGLAPTPEQAQMLSTRKFSVEELCRPFGVPPHMVGSQEPGASSYASADVNREVFVERSVIPLAVRIETQHNRLLTVPAGITDPNASVEFRFNLDGISRGNIQQRYTAYQLGIQSGMLRPNEARDKEDLAPVPGGDRLYMQAQMTPIDQLGMTMPTAAVEGAPL